MTDYNTVLNDKIKELKGRIIIKDRVINRLAIRDIGNNYYDNSNSNSY
jgi:hypothetical protein